MLPHPPGQDWMGYPLARSGWWGGVGGYYPGYPISGLDGEGGCYPIPLARTGWGTPWPGLDGGGGYYPGYPPGQDWMK